jgi:hypothetical protein
VEGKKYFADTPEKKDFSQHANAMAVLAGAIKGAEAKDLINRTLADENITQCTFYFRFYLYRAMKNAGLGDKYNEMLGPWKNMLSIGLSTFAERPEPTRSDCHAWSSSPNYEFLATVCGIEPAQPGFKSVLIEPHLGNLEWIEGAFPHPLGEISVKLKKTKSGGLTGELWLPQNLRGQYRHDGAVQALIPGLNQIK